jgi:hypothetical protein
MLASTEHDFPYTMAAPSRGPATLSAICASGYVVACNLVSALAMC